VTFERGGFNFGEIRGSGDSIGWNATVEKRVEKKQTSTGTKGCNTNGKHKNPITMLPTTSLTRNKASNKGRNNKSEICKAA